jgi:hypothetical protein
MGLFWANSRWIVSQKNSRWIGPKLRCISIESNGENLRGLIKRAGPILSPIFPFLLTQFPHDINVITCVFSISASSQRKIAKQCMETSGSTSRHQTLHEQMSFVMWTNSVASVKTRASWSDDSNRVIKNLRSRIGF